MRDDSEELQKALAQLAATKRAVSEQLVKAQAKVNLDAAAGLLPSGGADGGGSAGSGGASGGAAASAAAASSSGGATMAELAQLDKQLEVQTRRSLVVNV